MEDFMIELSKVLIKTENNRVIEVGSSKFISDTTDWIEIDSGIGDRYTHAQSQYFEKPLIDFTNSTHNYIYENNAVREATDAEREAELATFPPIPPTTEDRVTTLEADVMTNTEDIEILISSQFDTEVRIALLELEM